MGIQKLNNNPGVLNYAQPAFMNTLTTVLDITGKGVLNEFKAVGTGAGTNQPKVKITVDGVVKASPLDGNTILNVIKTGQLSSTPTIAQYICLNNIPFNSSLKIECIDAGAGSGMSCAIQYTLL